MSAKMRTWRRVSVDYEAAHPGEKLTPQAAKKISIHAERKLRRGLIDLAFELGILTEDDVVILKQAIYSQNDHILCSRRSRSRRIEDSDADLQQGGGIPVQQHGGCGRDEQYDLEEQSWDLFEAGIQGKADRRSADSQRDIRVPSPWKPLPKREEPASAEAGCAAIPSEETGSDETGESAGRRVESSVVGG